MSERPRSSRTPCAAESCPGLVLIDGGPALALVLVPFFDQPAETPVQHLAHHGVVVAGREVLALHVELAVLRFDEALRARHDHGADGI